MTPGLWLTAGLAVLLAGAPSAAVVRTAALGGSTRVAAPQRAVSRRPGRTRRWWRRLLPGCAAAGSAALMVTLGPAVAVAAGVTSGVIALLVRDGGRARTAQRRHDELRAAVRLIVAELEAGARPADALRAGAETAPMHAVTLRAAARATDAGDDAGGVLLADASTRVLGVAWQVCDRTGTALAAVLSHVARDLAAIDEQRRAVAVALSGPRSSAAVLTGLPVVGIALGAAMGAHPLPFLFGPGAGRTVLAAGVVLDAAGVLWMRRIVRRAQLR